jgi:hypothetical protein
MKLSDWWDGDQENRLTMARGLVAKLKPAVARVVQRELLRPNLVPASNPRAYRAYLKVIVTSPDGYVMHTRRWLQVLYGNEWEQELIDSIMQVQVTSEFEDMILHRLSVQYYRTNPNSLENVGPLDPDALPHDLPILIEPPPRPPSPVLDEDEDDLEALEEFLEMQDAYAPPPRRRRRVHPPPLPRRMPSRRAQAVGSRFASRPSRSFVAPRRRSTRAATTSEARARHIRGRYLSGGSRPMFAGGSQPIHLFDLEAEADGDHGGGEEAEDVPNAEDLAFIDDEVEAEGNHAQLDAQLQQQELDEEEAALALYVQSLRDNPPQEAPPPDRINAEREKHKGVFFLPDLHNNLCMYYSVHFSFLYATNRQELGKFRQKIKNLETSMTKYGQPWQNAAATRPSKAITAEVEPAVQACGHELVEATITKSSGTQVKVRVLEQPFEISSESLATLAEYYSVLANKKVAITVFVFNGPGSTHDEVNSWQSVVGDETPPDMWLGVWYDSKNQHAHPTYKPNLITSLYIHGKKQPQDYKVCNTCREPYHRANTNVHKCSILNPCNKCGKPHAGSRHTNIHEELEEGDEYEEKWCDLCFGVFYTQECFKWHIESTSGDGQTMCNTGYYCPESQTPDGGYDISQRCCNQRHQRPSKKIKEPTRYPDEHECGKPYYCDYCEDWVSATHPCFLTPKERKPVSDKYLYCDFESRQDAVYRKVDSLGTEVVQENQHVVNLVVTLSHTALEGDANVLQDSPLEPLQPGDSEQGWGAKHLSVESWLKWLLHPVFNEHRVVFHNGSGYDFQFVLQHICDSRWFKEKFELKGNPITRGNSVMTFKIKSKARDRKTKQPLVMVEFVDSFLFIESPIKKFPKIFGLDKNKLAKGDFPHYFNTLDISSKPPTSHHPPWEMYTTASMKHEDRVKLALHHHKNNSNPEWKFEPYKELERYCFMDVMVHRAGCVGFRDEMLSLTKHPVYCPDGIDPFACITKASFVKIVYETLFMPSDTLCAETPELTRIMRQAFAGGRTEAFVTYFNAAELNAAVGHGKKEDYSDDCSKPGEVELRRTGYKMGGADVCSLYPTVQKHDSYPKGQPRLVDELPDSTTLEQVLARPGHHLVCVDVEPPPEDERDIPLLWEKINGKLVFAYFPIKHKWYPDIELSKALEKGYTFPKVWSYVEWPETTTDLFGGFVDRFLKIKHEASGWPKKNMTEEEKEAHLSAILAADGIALDRVNIPKEGKNQGKRQVSKVCLNSLWGKFGERMAEDQTSTLIVTDTNQTSMEQMHEILAEGRITDMCLLSEHTAVVMYHQKTDDDPRLVSLQKQAEDNGWADPDVNEFLTTDPFGVAIPKILAPAKKYKKHVPRPQLALDHKRNTGVAVYTTAHARLRLYALLEKVGKDNLVYCDTDSIYFLVPPNTEPVLELGLGLGKLTNEVDEKSEYEWTDKHISLWYSGGPKAYLKYILDPSDPISEEMCIKWKLRQISMGPQIKDLADGEGHDDLAALAQRLVDGEPTEQDLIEIKADPKFKETILDMQGKLKLKGHNYNSLVAQESITYDKFAEVVTHRLADPERLVSVEEGGVQTYTDTALRKVSKFNIATVTEKKTLRENFVKRKLIPVADISEAGICRTEAWTSREEYCNKVYRVGKEMAALC